MQTCSQCGSQNGADARFCSQCGSALATDEPGATETTATISLAARQEVEDRLALNDEDAAAASALPEGSALLIVQRGPGAGNRFLLDTDLVSAGRHPESDIFLDDVTVSRRHVEFHRTEGTYRVHDVGSLNGTYVNRDRIDDAVLQNGDEVRIGKFRMVFFIGSRAEG